MRALLTGLLLVALASHAWAAEKSKKLYRWVDAQGNVHYSDEPQKGATEIPMPEVTTIKMKPPKLIDLSQNVGKNQQQSKKEDYISLKMASPVDGAIITNEAGHLDITVSLLPGLQQDDKLRFFLDGKPLEKDQTSTTLSVDGLATGEHNASVIVVDKNGQTLIDSDSVKFILLSRLPESLIKKP